MQLLRMTTAEPGADRLRSQLQRELKQGKRVLWLIPGGSNIPFSVDIMQAIPDELTDNLILALTDERYGDEGHADSNWQQLDEAGFDTKHAMQVKVLSGPGKGLQETATDYGQTMAPLLSGSDVVIGQFGMGPDGHIAGILPDSPAVSATGLAVGYEASQFQRITLTFEAIRHCESMYVFAFGAAKKPMLENLERDLPVAEQPAQIVKQVPESFVCNDQIGDEV